MARYKKQGFDLNALGAKGDRARKRLIKSDPFAQLFIWLFIKLLPFIIFLIVIDLVLHQACGIKIIPEETQQAPASKPTPSPRPFTFPQKKI